MNALTPRAETGVILIVDDTPDNLALLSDALDEAGYMVLVALDGTSALNRIQRRRPDLILLDAMMPGLDGFETCRQIKRQPDTANIPVLFMTALTDSEHVVQGFEAGAIDYVTKPIQCAEVLARVASHLRTARILQTARDAQPIGLDHPPAYDRLATRFQLTEREFEVLRWVSCGKTNKDIADILQLSPRTVNKHLEHIYIKLGVETRTAATSVAMAAMTERVP
ncbi:response regulator [Pseudomonas sp. GD03842]|uniref:response regulator n=1 Tax=unclassified Pseudomonas TaxID=196821 RepID=UPI000D3B3594|nr:MULTISPECIES: response regulator [unclassified Pseudomonas]MDH0748700.1 response regulator [Pseudomonas sp. GD03842]RAU44351.1 DNA-binding response regulator [Pseudomonas sp. RIT 409]RAU51002.1 DNA-binding response regulator [Pseudomonas sp. RIT 412]